MPSRTVLLTLAALLSGFAPTASAASRRGTPEVLTSFSGESNLIGSGSAVGHGDAYAVFHRIIGKNLYTVVFRDADGHAHRFDLPTQPGFFPYAVRFAALEEGGGMALWDDPRTDQVLARSWRPDGTLGATQPVLTDVHVVHGGDTDVAQWQLRTDGLGTVVVASPGAPARGPGSIVAAVRVPGGGFGAAQVLNPGEAPGSVEREFDVSPVAGDGSVTISWGPDYGDGGGGRATRAGGAAAFAPAETAPFAADPGLTPSHRATVTEDGAPVALSERLAALCPCGRPRVFTWPGGARVLTFVRVATRTPASGDWYVAHPDASGTFDLAERGTAVDGALAIRRERPGEIGFARFDTTVAGPPFGTRPARLVVVPFGPQVPRSRRAPRVRFESRALATARHLLVPLACDRECTISGRDAGGASAPVRDFRGAGAPARAEAFQVAYLRLTPGDRTRVRVLLRATDDAGHVTRLGASFAWRGSRAGWCRVGAPHC